MLRRLGIGTVLVAVGVFLALALPGPARTPAAPVPVDPAEQAQTVAALAPRRTPPVVAVLGQNDGPRPPSTTTRVPVCGPRPGRTAAISSSVCVSSAFSTRGRSSQTRAIAPSRSTTSRSGVTRAPS